MTPEPAPPLQTSAPHQRKDVCPLCVIQRETAHIHCGASVELPGSEVETLPLVHFGLGFPSGSRILLIFSILTSGVIDSTDP
ncbi:hypothetical protein AVEN_100128-1 [Araneus ventricosus]|uniref:Uncharacterized protein n=1 Tax=Araneus ventricosus TaxID=182803 RepID=A0A4Y2W111_ARAVE|nr:hypothetical protein AVEN_100128-1 [Araneus ventricosus]